MPQRWESVYMNLMTNDHDWDSAMGLGRTAAFLCHDSPGPYEEIRDHQGTDGRCGHANYDYAFNNPKAQFSGKTLSLDEYKAARTVCEPFGLNDCCPVTDGASVVITGFRRKSQSHD